MAAGSTYTPIATTTLGSAAASFTFSSIPSTYTDLVLVAFLNTSSLVNGWMRFNGDSGSNYSVTRLYGGGSGAFSDRFTNDSAITIGDLNTATNSTNIIHIMNYANTTTNKTALIRTNPSGRPMGANVGLWRNTAAINSITITSSANLSAGCTLTLYGIAAA